MRDTLISRPTVVDFDTFFIPFTTTISLNWPHNPRDVLIPASKAHSLSAAASSPYSNAASPLGNPHLSNPFAPASHHDDEPWVMNPAFEAHLRNLNNWSLGPAFRAAFPEASATVRFEDYGHENR